MEIEPNMLYTPEQIEQQRIGARLLLMKLLSEVRNDWNGSGTKIWANQELRIMEEQDEDI